MPLTVSFTVSQTLGLPNKITLTDTSTGTDVAVVSRRVTFTDKDGKTYVQSGTATTYEVWGGFPGTTTISLDVLDRDRALYVRVEWVNSGGTVLYTSTLLRQLPLYAKTYYLNLIKAMQAVEKLKDSANFYYHLINLETSLKQASDAVDLLNDIHSAQAALNRAKKLIDNPSYFF
jgi:hypothetical protein